MEDVLDVYHRPYDPARPQVCVDEVPKQLVGEARAPVSAEPGRPARVDYEYRRCGVANVFLAFEPLLGWRAAPVTERRTKRDFAAVLRWLAEDVYPDAAAVVLVTDNLNTHGPGCLYEAFAPDRARRIAAKLEWHYPPKHGSWLNMAEIELSALGRQCLNRRIDSLPALTEQVAAWEADRNGREVEAKWRFTTDDARIKLHQLYPSLQ
jgi:hypothetical protein